MMQDQGSEMQDDQDENEPQIPIINSPIAKSLPLIASGTLKYPSMFNQNFLDDPINDPQSGSLKELGKAGSEQPGAASTHDRAPSSMHIVDIADGEVLGKQHSTRNSANANSHQSNRTLKKYASGQQQRSAA